MNGALLMRRRRRKPEINIVPLIDISVKLIFFFVVSMQFRETSVLNVSLPTAETAGQSSLDEVIVIVIGEDGSFAFDGALLDKSGLEAALGREASGGATGGRTVLIRSDQKTPVQAVVDAMDACRKVGLSSIRFQTR